MSDLMLKAVLRMPYEMAMDDELSRKQFYDRAQQALDLAESLQSVINETIEMCAEEVEERGSRFEAEIIRALKDNYDR